MSARSDFRPACPIPTCAHLNAAEADYCEKCGAPLTEDAQKRRPAISRLRRHVDALKKDVLRRDAANRKLLASLTQHVRGEATGNAKPSLRCIYCGNPTHGLVCVAHVDLVPLDLEVLL